MRKQRGDTIIEVLFAMAAIGVVLGTSFGIANRSLAIGREAQERSEALKIAESQIEFIKMAYDRDAPAIRTRGNNFCFYRTGGALAIGEVGTAQCNDRSFDGGSGIYTIVVDPTRTPPEPNNQFDVYVTWGRLASNQNTPNSLKLIYRPGVSP